MAKQRNGGTKPGLNTKISSPFPGKKKLKDFFKKNVTAL